MKKFLFGSLSLLLAFVWVAESADFVTPPSGTSLPNATINDVRIGVTGNAIIDTQSGNPLILGASTGVQIGSGGILSTLVTEANHTFAQRNGTNAQTLRVYNTFTDAANYERISINNSAFGANFPGVVFEAAGTGGARNFFIGNTTNASLSLVANNATRWVISAVGNFNSNANNTGGIGGTAVGTLSGVPLFINVGVNGLGFDRTNTAGGTTGAQTINKSAGSVNFAAAASSLVVTNSLVTATSNIIATVQTNDGTLKSVQAVPASGSFTLFGNAAATAETRVAFIVTN
jgi:hypothetical protein